MEPVFAQTPEERAELAARQAENQTAYVMMTAGPPPGYGAAATSLKATHEPFAQTRTDLRASTSETTRSDSVSGQELARKLHPYAVSALRVLSIVGSIALGAFTALAVAGFMTTPLGWAFAGALVGIGLAGSLYYGSPKEFLKTLVLSVGGFGLGFGAATVAVGYGAAGAALAKVVVAEKMQAAGVVVGSIGAAILLVWAKESLKEWGHRGGTSPSSPDV